MSTAREPVAAWRRYDMNGYPLREVVQEDRCAECGMGLVAPTEFHPWRACEVFKETHNSNRVWEALMPLVEEIQRDREEARRGA